MEGAVEGSVGEVSKSAISGRGWPCLKEGADAVTCITINNAGHVDMDISNVGACCIEYFMLQ